MVEAFIASLSDAVMTATPVAPFAGLVELTVGAMLSPPGPLGFLSDELHPAIAIRNTANGNTALILLLRTFIRFLLVVWCRAARAALRRLSAAWRRESHRTPKLEQVPAQHAPTRSVTRRSQRMKGAMRPRGIEVVDRSLQESPVERPFVVAGGSGSPVIHGPEWKEVQKAATFFKCVAYRSS
jgi:hypothetical protein